MHGIISSPDPEDYGGGSFPLVFTNETGQNTPVCVPAEDVVIVNDTIVEQDETFSVQLITDDTQVELSPQNGTATIIDDDGNSFLLAYVCNLQNNTSHFILQLLILWDQCSG